MCALCVAADTLSLFELSHFTFLHSANMFTQCHRACLQSCLLVYLMAGMLAQRVDPMRVMATMKTQAFWWPSRRRGHDGGGGGGRGGWSYSPMLDRRSGSFGGCQQLPNCSPAETAAEDLMGRTDGG